MFCFGYQKKDNHMDPMAGNRFGTTNPTIMEEPFWKNMVCNPELTAYDARVQIGHKPSHNAPVWCFARFGATQTYLPDGRLICIGGEHEDYYDPDFLIYNDVTVIENPRIVKCSDGYGTPIPSNFPGAKEIEQSRIRGQYLMLGTPNENDVTIYGYPADVFPPTDFHTATYVRINGQEFIYIIGGTGSSYNVDVDSSTLYKQLKHCDDTRIFRLCVSDFRIERVETTGVIPRGCTNQHTAKLLTVGDRPIIEIEISPKSIQHCDSKGWEHHRRLYRLDIKTGEWLDHLKSAGSTGKQ